MIYEFQAIQDLHGWGKPWGPGANVNLISLDESNMVRMSGGTYFTPIYGENSFKFQDVERVAALSVVFEFIPEVTNDMVGDIYTRSAITGGVDFRFVASNTGTAWDSGAVIEISGTTITITEDHVGHAIGVRFYNDSGTDKLITNVQVESGATATAFTPYSNVCMPEGFNIWDPINAEYVQVYAGYVNANTRELYLRPWYTEYAGEELVGPWMSSLDEYSEDATPTEGAFVIDFGGELTSLEITPFMLQTLLDSLGIRQHFTNGAGLLNSLMDQAQGRVRSEEELLHLSRPLKVIAIGDQLPAGLKIRPISKDVLPGLPGKFIR